MICSFFKKIGLSIALLFSSMGTMFHKTKSIKPQSAAIYQQKEDNEFVIRKAVDLVETSTSINIDEIKIIKELTLKERIKEQEALLKQLRKERKAEKAAKKEAAYQQWKAQQKEVMDEIDRRLAQSPKKMEVYGTWTLTDEQINAVIAKPNNVKIRSFDEPNDLFE